MLLFPPYAQPALLAVILTCQARRLLSYVPCAGEAHTVVPYSVPRHQSAPAALRVPMALLAAHRALQHVCCALQAGTASWIKFRRPVLVAQRAYMPMSTAPALVLFARLAAAVPFLPVQVPLAVPPAASADIFLV